MLWFILGIFFILPGLFLVIKPGSPSWAFRLGGMVAVLLGLLLVFSGMTYHVDAKDVGVVKSFGKPIGQEGPGLHVKAPWQSVTQIDGTTQVDEYTGDALPVRIGDGSLSYLSATVRWHINLDRADEVYASYRSNDPTQNLRHAVVDTQFKAAAQDVMSKYNPVAQLKVIDKGDIQDTANINFAPNYDQVATDLDSQMETRLGNDPQVIIDSITVSGLTLAESTQTTLNNFIKAVGETRVTAQEAITKQQEAAGNRNLAKSLKNNPELLISKCLDEVDEARQGGYQLPVGFNCLGGSGNLVLAQGSTPEAQK